MTAWVKETKIEDLASVSMMSQGKWKRYVSQELDGREDEPLVGLFFKV